jgi:hypothetical protein
MHWSLGQLRDLDLDEYSELITWAQDKGKDPDSRDMDEVIDAMKQKPVSEDSE